MSMPYTPTWVAADGTTHVLDGTNGVLVTRELQGRGMPPMDLVADAVVGLDGSRVRHARAEEREEVVPVVVYGEDVRARLRTLASLFDPRRGDGRLQWDDREIVCRYTDGLLLKEADGGETWQRAVLTFTAFDPMYRDVDPTVRLVDIAALAFLKDPWFEWSLVSSSALGRFTIDNDGDDEAWPVWTVQGPGGPVTLTNETTGDVLEIDTVLAAGEQLHIDTRPGAKTVTGPGDTNLYPDLSDASTLWPLARGTQTVTIELPDAAAGASNVRLEWRRRWLTV